MTITKWLALRALAKLLASPLGVRLLKAYAFRTPHRHLHDKDGSLYMGRWHVVDEDTLGGRILEKLTGYASIRLHRIMRADHDRDLHNHPFSYRTFIVGGFYGERAQFGLYGQPFYRVLWAGDTARSGAQHFHRITDVSPGGVWTLFCMTRNTGTWGFNVNGKFQESTRYLLRNGYRREQVQEVQTR